MCPFFDFHSKNVLLPKSFFYSVVRRVYMCVCIYIKIELKTVCTTDIYIVYDAVTNIKCEGMNLIAKNGFV